MDSPAQRIDTEPERSQHSPRENLEEGLVVARVRLEVSEVVIGPTETEPRSITLRGGDEVPDWALEVCSHPRTIDLEEDE